tara:strand:- start:115 stop:309 length:195 start_codon:yes stop_codon:yes gene_type:complete
MAKKRKLRKSGLLDRKRPRRPAAPVASVPVTPVVVEEEPQVEVKKEPAPKRRSSAKKVAKKKEK